MKSALVKHDDANDSSTILRDEQGQSMIFVALCMTVLIGFIGVSVDAGHFRYVERTMQTAADAAALAGAMEVRICGGVQNCQTMQTSAQNAIVENGYSVDNLLTDCSGSPSTGLTLMIDNPPCADSSDPNNGPLKLNYVEAVVTNQVPTYFARILGISTITATTRAEAERGIGGPCIYALDPTGAGAITLAAGVLVDSKCGVVDESNNSAALACLIGIGIHAPSISVTGGAEGLLNGLLCGSQPPPKTNVAAPNPRDPLAYLPVPPAASESCGTTTTSPYTGSPTEVQILLTAGNTVVFNPGVYCGGIAISAPASAAITFTPGMYILRQGSGGVLNAQTTGGLTITLAASSTITGDGVTFYSQEGSNQSVNGFSVTAPATLGLGAINLSAPTSGEYGGVLFFQAQGNTSPGTFLLNLAQGSSLTGAIYEPSATVSYGVSVASSTYNILVADDINFLANIDSSFGNDYSTLVSGSPLDGDNVTLVQ
jgi:Flp pilus assembly protein TadG